MSESDLWHQMYQEAEAERDHIWAALTSIAQYDPRWIWQRVNDAPSRRQLIERAFDAVIAISFDGDMERAKNTVPPRELRAATHQPLLPDGHNGSLDG